MHVVNWFSFDLKKCMIFSSLWVLTSTMTWLIAIKKTTFHKIFSKNLERIVEVKVHFSILGMLVRKSPRLKKITRKQITKYNEK